MARAAPFETGAQNQPLGAPDNFLIRRFETHVSATPDAVAVVCGSESLSYAAEHITSAEDGGLLLVGVDTQVYFGFLRCGAQGAITGIGNCLPNEVIYLVDLCRRAADGDSEARRYAKELDEALAVLSRFDEGPDLTLYYRLIASETIDPIYRRPALATRQPARARFASSRPGVPLLEFRSLNAR